MPLHSILAAIPCFILAVLAGLHFHWAAGGGSGIGAAVPSVDGRPLFSPGPLACIAVGLALVAAAGVLALRGDLVSLPLPEWISRLGTWGVAGVFALRSVGDFRYVGFFKRVRGTPFARRDSLIYSPLCASIACLTVGLAIWAP